MLRGLVTLSEPIHHEQGEARRQLVHFQKKKAIFDDFSVFFVQVATKLMLYIQGVHHVLTSISSINCRANDHGCQIETKSKCKSRSRGNKLCSQLDPSGVLTFLPYLFLYLIFCEEAFLCHIVFMSIISYRLSHEYMG
jgi:hypothetical protein